jgi:ketosteroid isomerase-like protein
MKKLLFSAIAMLLCTSLVFAQSKKEECAQLIEANKQLTLNIKNYTDRWDKIFNKGDIDQINNSFFDDSVIWRRQKDEKVGGTGIEAFKKHFNYYLLTFSDIKFTIIEVFGQGDNLVKHWNFKGIHRKTGNTMDLSGVTLVKMKNGKVIEEQDFDDNYWYKQQLGEIPMK